jgi:hypothetical protein
MKSRPKPGRRRKDDPLQKLTDAEKVALRYRSQLVEMLDDLHRSVRMAPPEMDIPRESIVGLLKAAYYLLDVNDGLRETDDEYFVRSAIQELEKALGPLGLGLDYWDKINAWRLRDLKEGGGEFFAAE